MSVILLLNTGMQHPRAKRRRFWIEPGQVVGIGQQAWMWLEVDCIDDEYVPAVRIRTPARGTQAAGVQQHRLPATTWLDLTAFCGVMAIPRAMELAGERPDRILMEFVTVDDALLWSTPA